MFNVMKLGINTVLFKAFDVKTALKAIKLAGYDGAELSAIQGMCEHLVLDAWETQVPLVKAAAKEAGVDLIVAAPVYDPDECGVEEFLDRRRQSEDILGSLMNDELPEVMPAAMTKFSERLLTEENLPELCFGNNCFLLNMKGIEWNDTTEAVLRRLTGKLGMNVILTDAGETVLKNSEKLRQLGVHVMLDLNELHHKKQIRAYLPLIGSGLVCAIGSDWASEAPYRFLRKTKKRMDEAFETVMAASAHLLGK